VSRGLRVAVVGATGAVGSQIVTTLEERRFPVAALTLLASARSAGQTVSYLKSPTLVEEVTAERFSGVDLAFFSVGADVSAHYAPAAVAAGAIVIDKSSHFRMDPGVPLVVPEVNAAHLEGHQGIISSPNCSTIQMVMALKPLLDLAPIRRVVVSTYQSVSGTGREAIEELARQSREILEGKPASVSVYPRQIAFNALPHIDSFDASGYTLEELKLTFETRKILGLPDLAITATAVRVPVFFGHSEAIHVEFDAPVTPDEARAALAAFPGVKVVDSPVDQEYPTAAGPTGAAGRDEVFVGRIRRDPTVPYGLAMWVVADNLRKGAATNAVQIAETLLGRQAQQGRGQRG
jgi:aspartate-semialdehyde dehydrogenase